MKLNMVANDPTLREVISSAIGELRTITINELIQTENEDKRAELKERQLLLEYESKAVLGDDDTAKSIQDKALRFYSPMLKKYYGKI